MHNQARSRRPSLVSDDLACKVNERVHDNKNFTISDLYLHFHQISRILQFFCFTITLGRTLLLRLKTSFRWEQMDHPPYRPDFAPSDFHLFLHLKKFLGVKQFDDDNDLKMQCRSSFIYSCSYDLQYAPQWAMRYGTSQNMYRVNIVTRQPFPSPTRQLLLSLIKH